MGWRARRRSRTCDSGRVSLETYRERGLPRRAEIERFASLPGAAGLALRCGAPRLMGAFETLNQRIRGSAACVEPAPHGRAAASGEPLA